MNKAGKIHPFSSLASCWISWHAQDSVWTRRDQPGFFFPALSDISDPKSSVIRKKVPEDSRASSGPARRIVNVISFCFCLSRAYKQEAAQVRGLNTS